MNYEQQGARTGGSLIVQVTTAGGAFPVQGAAVTVRATGEGGMPFLQTVYTDGSGRTPILELDTPPASSSLSPGIRNPYATYDIRVEREGFFVHENRNAPVFSGIYSIQNVDLIPLSPYGGDRPPAGSTDFSSEQSLNGGT